MKPKSYLKNEGGDSLYDLAEVLRSKNAGPFFITFDIILPSKALYKRVIDSTVLNPALVGELYGIDPKDVQIIPFQTARAIKITFPRQGPSSGAPGDTDDYGAQQHLPLCSIRIP